jgi:hypothetical protein
VRTSSRNYLSISAEEHAINQSYHIHIKICDLLKEVSWVLNTNSIHMLIKLRCNGAGRVAQMQGRDMKCLQKFCVETSWKTEFWMIETVER